MCLNNKTPCPTLELLAASDAYILIWAGPYHVPHYEFEVEKNKMRYITWHDISDSWSWVDDVVFISRHHPLRHNVNAVVGDIRASFRASLVNVAAVVTKVCS